VRLFVAAEIEPHVRAAAASLVNDLTQRAGRLSPQARITWIPEDRLHITIRFIGSVDEEVADAIRAALEPPIELAPFEIAVAGTGTFPGRGAPRVIWAGLQAGRESLIAAEREVSERLARLGIPPEPRPFSPHLTLARVRDAAGANAARLLDGVEREMVGTTRVDAITLFESRLSPRGSTYLALQRTPLWKKSS
jgi:RNA 2',3'-cyclic 3'-phosphodiesterase